MLEHRGQKLLAKIRELLAQYWEKLRKRSRP